MQRLSYALKVFLKDLCRSIVISILFLPDVFHDGKIIIKIELDFLMCYQNIIFSEKV